MGDYRMRARLASVQLQGGVRPSLTCIVEIQVPAKVDRQEVSRFQLSNFTGILALSGPPELLVGPLTSSRPEILAYGGHSQQVSFNVWIQNSTVEELEKHRRAGDGHLHFVMTSNMIEATAWLQFENEQLTGPHGIQVESLGQFCP